MMAWVQIIQEGEKGFRLRSCGAITSEIPSAIRPTDVPIIIARFLSGSRNASSHITARSMRNPANCNWLARKRSVTSTLAASGKKRVIAARPPNAITVVIAASNERKIKIARIIVRLSGTDRLLWKSAVYPRHGLRKVPRTQDVGYEYWAG